MSELGNWKFVISDSIQYDEMTSYPSHLDETIAELGLPDNNLSRAKLMVQELHSDTKQVTFHWNDSSIILNTDDVVNFQPFVRATGTSSSAPPDTAFFYILNGVEHEVKKKS